MKSIRSKMLAGIVALVCGAVIVMGGVSAFLSQKGTLDTLNKTMMEAVEVTSEMVSEQLVVYKTAVAEIGAEIEDIVTLMQGAYTDEQKIAFLKSKTSEYGFTAVGYVDLNGNCKITNRNIANEEYFKQAASGTEYVTEPMINPDGNSAKIIIAAPLKTNNVVRSVIYYELDAKSLSEIVSNINVGETGSAYMLDRNGNVIAHESYDLVLTKDNSIQQAKSDKKLETVASIETDMINGNSGFRTYKYGGNTKIATYAPVAGTNGWSIAVTAERNEFMESTYRGIYIALGIGILAVVVAVLIAIKLSTAIANPIRKCVERLELLAKGDLKTEVPKIDTKDETGILAACTEKTVTSLNEIINDMTYNLGQISDGNLRLEIAKEYAGDFIPLKTAMNKIISSLNSVLSQINQASDQVASGSDQVSSAAQALSQGATEQASSVQELSASINEISEQVKANAANSVNANNLASEAGQKLLVGDAEMAKMLEAMNEINNTSKQISNIIKTIDDIAFQTNILALNAAVEAARAGSAGKGFAVVADEVRNLASKSAEAAKGTTELIESSIKAVDNGTRIADTTAKTLKEVMVSAKQSNDLINEISNASNEQATAITQITQGVEQISDVVQTNSATAEENAAASEELSGQAQMLNRLVSDFKLKNDEDYTAGIPMENDDETEDTSSDNEEEDDGCLF